METWFRRLFGRNPAKHNQTKTVNPGGISCQEVVELITDYLEDALLPEKHAQIDEHLAGCDGCTNYLEQVRMTVGMLRGLAEKPTFPEDREDLLKIFRQWKNNQE